MNKLIIVFTGLLFFSTLSAQIGVNTENPQKLLHINGNNESTTTDDVVVTEKGTVGIGTATPNENLKLEVDGKLLNSANEGDVTVGGNNTIGGNLNASKIGVGTQNPQTSLHITPKAGVAPLRLADGSEESSYLLTTDANGNASWGALRPMSSIINTSFKTSRTISGKDDVSVGRVIVSDTMTLIPGKWLIFARAVTTGSTLSNLYMYLILSQIDSYNTTTSLSRVGARAATTEDNIAANQLMYYANITEPTSFFLGMSSSGTGALFNNDEQYGNYFYAVRIDREDP